MNFACIVICNCRWHQHEAFVLALRDWWIIDAPLLNKWALWIHMKNMSSTTDIHKGIDFLGGWVRTWYHDWEGFQGEFLLPSVSCFSLLLAFTSNLLASCLGSSFGDTSSFGRVWLWIKPGDGRYLSDLPRLSIESSRWRKLFSDYSSIPFVCQNPPPKPHGVLLYIASQQCSLEPFNWDDCRSLNPSADCADVATACWCGVWVYDGTEQVGWNSPGLGWPHAWAGFWATKEEVYVLDGERVCYPTQIALRLWCLPVNQWQRLVHIGLEDGDKHQAAAGKILLHCCKSSGHSWKVWMAKLTL